MLCFQNDTDTKMARFNIEIAWHQTTPTQSSKQHNDVIAWHITIQYEITSIKQQ